MDDFGDLLDALPTEVYYGPQIPVAREDASVSILSLPTELLQAIADGCSNRTILNLMRVNTVFYSVALRRFYANVHISTSKFSGALEAIGQDLSIEEILPRLYRKRFGVLGGLLRRQEHLDNLRLLHLIDYPVPLAPGHVTYHKIIRHVLEKATSIQSIVLPWSNIGRTAGFEGLVISSSLRSVSTPMINSAIVSSILQTAWLQSLQITFQCATFESLHKLVDHMAPTLKDLQCLIHIPKDEWEMSVAQIEPFISKFTHLENLKLGYCTCGWAADPDPQVPIHCYAKFVKNLPNLKTVVIIDRRHIPGQENVQPDERRLVDVLSEANPVLQTIEIEYLFPSQGDSPTDKVVKWTAFKSDLEEDAASVYSGSSDGIEGYECIWTPSPHLISRWGFWFEKFGKPHQVREAMFQRWSGPDDWKPSIWHLEWQHTYHRSA